MTQTLWIVVAVVAVLIVVAVVLGLVLRRSRRISLREAQERERLKPPRAGTYQAEGGFTFSAGTETPAPPRPRADASSAPAVGDQAAPTEAPPIAPGTDAGPAAPVVVPPPAEPAPAADTTSGLAQDVPAADTTTTVPGGPSTNGVAPAATPTDIAPAEGRMERLRGRLSRSRSGFGQGLLGLLGAGELDEESWEDVETMLLQADLGPEMTVELVDTLRTELARRGVRTTEQARTLLRDVLTDALRTDLDRSVRALPHDGRPAVLLVVGVNGTGKTTTTGKLARVLVAGGRHVVLGAADTFRAAAAEQLTTWGERAGATVVRGPEGADPASVAFDAVKQGTEEGADAVLLDTAGRLHTKTGLMDELGKVKRVVSRQSIVDEVLLVLDATTGQNGLTQARVFGDVVDVTGIVLTKLDGTAKGGIVFRVQRELGVPVKLVGLGEGPDDLAPFEPAAFVDALLD
ncbi:MAG: fused signal recognition particle receptor [Pseudonocardiales bacterium]|nr:fused signal recognition particle receptor [Pseudonocardiales bacterium]